MRHIKWIAVTIVVSLLATGCWGRYELNRVGIMVGIGVDLVKPGWYRFTYQEVNPSGVSPQGAGGVTSPINTIVTTGPTIAASIRKTAQKISRRILTPHVQILVIGEDAAREGITGILDMFERDDKLRWNTQLLIAKGARAEEVLKVQTPVYKLPALRLAHQSITGEELWGENIAVNVMEAAQAIASTGTEPAVSGVELIGNSAEGSKDSNVATSSPPVQIDMNGVAIFKGDRLKHWMTPHESRGTTWILDKIGSTMITVDCPQYKQERITMEVLRSQTKVHVETKGNKPQIRVGIEAEAKIAESDCPYKLDEAASLDRLEKRTATAIKKEADAAVKVAQEQRSDIFGFGEAIHRSDPKTWKRIKQNWNDRFAQADVAVEVKFLLRGTGMISNRIKKKG